MNDDASYWERVNVAAVEWWQRQHPAHPLICRNDAGHRLLQAHYDGQRAGLRCLDCDYRQAIPEHVIAEYYRTHPVATLGPE